MLVEQTLFGEQDRVKIAIERLQMHQPSEPYYLAFSGGKDSVAIYRLAQMAGMRFDAHYHPTTIDPPELVRFIKREYPDAQRSHPERSMWEVICANQWPPTRRIRYCCEEFKEQYGQGRTVVTGVRWAESVRRRSRRMVETCNRDATMTYLHPIIDWSDAEVWQFIRQEKIPYCSLYDEGFARIGCVLCPMASDPQRDIARWPHIAAKFVQTFDKVIALRAASGKTTTFKTGAEMFAWWVQRNTKGRNPDQLMMFE